MGARVAVSIRPRRQLIASPGAAAVGALLLAGVGVRIYAILSYPPAVLTAHAHDAANYVEAARLGLGGEPRSPRGTRCSCALPTSSATSSSLRSPASTRSDRRRSTAVPGGPSSRRAPVGGLRLAAILWLNGDELFLEHALLSEPLSAAALAATLYAAVRALHGGVGWPLAVGVLVASFADDPHRERAAPPAGRDLAGRRVAPDGPAVDASCRARPPGRDRRFWQAYARGSVRGGGTSDLLPLAELARTPLLAGGRISPTAGTSRHRGAPGCCAIERRPASVLARSITCGWAAPDAQPSERRPCTTICWRSSHWPRSSTSRWTTSGWWGL